MRLKNNVLKGLNSDCNLTTGFICTDTLIILDSPLCEGVFGSEKLSVPKKSKRKTGLFLDCTDRLRFSYYS